MSKFSKVVLTKKKIVITRTARAQKAPRAVNNVFIRDEALLMLFSPVSPDISQLEMKFRGWIWRKCGIFHTFWLEFTSREWRFSDKFDTFNIKFEFFMLKNPLCTMNRSTNVYGVETLRVIEQGSFCIKVTGAIDVMLRFLSSCFLLAAITPGDAEQCVLFGKCLVCHLNVILSSKFDIKRVKFLTETTFSTLALLPRKHLYS